MSTATQRPTRGYRTIRLPISEADYERFMTENGFAKVRLDELYEQHPEPFPVGFDQGYALFGFTDPSGTQRRRCRRVRLSRDTTVWTIAPAFVMPYLTAVVRDRCDKRARFSRRYDHARAHRPSNRVDRLMRFLDRACFNAQSFHGTVASAERRVRAPALLWNFCPSSPETVKKHHGQRCPAERLNGKRYADNWLENLLVSGSMNGLWHHQQNPL